MTRRRVALLGLAVTLGGLLSPVATGLVASPANARPQGQPTVGLAAEPNGKGYWQASRDGAVDAFGSAPFLGSLTGRRLNAPVVGIAADDDEGYWLATADGGVFAFGHAMWLGSMAGMPLNSRVIAIVSTPTGNGYWLIAGDGGVFAFGDAEFLGSTGDTVLNAPIVAAASTAGARGYWLVAGDGGVFAFGNAEFLGSTGDMVLNAPIVGVADDPTGGYWIVAADGGVFAYGAPFTSSVADQVLPAPVVGVTRTTDGLGAWIVTADGSVYGFGVSSFFGTPPNLPPPPEPPDLTVTTIASGLTIPWDMAFTPDGVLLFDERGGKISVLADGATRTIATVSSVHSDREMGLLGLTLDPDFATTRAFYTCYVNESPRDERVTRWTVNGDYTAAVEDSTPLLVGIPATNPTHNGCRLRVGPDGDLWIGTGDSLELAGPQDPTSLAGKVLRIDRQTGAPAAGNPFGTPVFTLGHRNVEGLVFRPGTNQAFSIEHGTFRDDEINLLVPGGNYGWDPAGWENEEAAPMTDFDRHPDAIGPVWSSRNPTIATSGGTFLFGDQWGPWNGVLAIACLKATQIHLIWLNDAGHPVTEASAITGFGRLRTPVQGPDGALYIATSNGSGKDRIIRVEPTADPMDDHSGPG